MTIAYLMDLIFPSIFGILFLCAEGWAYSLHTKEKDYVGFGVTPKEAEENALALFFELLTKS